jgi:hypothetical protein
MCKKIWDWVVALFKGRGKEAVRLQFNLVSATGTIIRKDITMLILTNSQEVDLAIQPLDARGKPAQVDGVPVWTNSAPTKASLVVSADGLSCIVKALDNGSVQIGVSADADLGTGVKTITGLLDIEIVSGQAVTMGIIAGTPREQVI